MNTPTATHVDRALVEIEDWKQERKARELAFYRKALAHGELSVHVGKECTTKKSLCDICLTQQMPGSRKFWYHGKHGGFWWFHPCEHCFAELEADVHVLVISPIPQTVTGSQVIS